MPMQTCTLSRIAAALLVSSLVAVAPGGASAASVRIAHDPGGALDDYSKRYSALRDSGDSVMVDGPCDSFCTLVLVYVPKDRICVTGKASFGFHLVVGGPNDSYPVP